MVEVEVRSWDKESTGPLGPHMQDRGLFLGHAKNCKFGCLQLLIMSAVIGTTTRISQLMYNRVPSSRSIFFF